MQLNRKRKRPPTPEIESPIRRVKKVRLSEPLLPQFVQPLNPSRSLQRPMIAQPAIEQPVLNQPHRSVVQVVRTANIARVEPIQLSQADLQALRASFRRQPRVLIPRDTTILPVRLFTRRTYTLEDIWRVVYFRYGSLDDFTQKMLSFVDVSKLTGIPQETVRRQLDQFEKDGFTVFIRRHYNGEQGPRPKIFLQMEQRLKSEQCLQDWSGWTLQQRINEIRNIYNVNLNPASLWQFYKKHNIKYRHTNYIHFHIQTDVWKIKRDNFVVNLARIIQQNSLLCYMDETSVHSWLRSSKTYKGPRDNVMFVQQARRPGVTIFGCISNFTQRLIWMQGDSTNTTDVCRFLQMIRAACIYPADQRITMVLDNHKAHATNQTTLLFQSLNMDALFMPSYSPQFNSIETLWGLFKKRFKHLMAQDVQTHALTNDLYAGKISTALQFAPDIIRKSMSFNRNAIESHLKLMQQRSEEF